MLDGVSDDAFAKHALGSGLATAGQIDAAKRLQADGGAASLAEALVKLGILTPVQRESAEKKLLEKKENAQQIGGRRILRKLGEGGMGAVYLAEGPDGAKVAVKVLAKAHALNPEFLRRFKREVEAATALRHPNLVRALSAGEDRGHPFLVMEYVEGESLRKVLERRKALPVPEACGLALQLAKGLHHAHELGFLHRDVKPENVVLGGDGVAKILDFGLAKNLGDGASSFLTVTGATLGTPHYMSPEQARGEKSIDRRSDLYSLGATLYHLLTGETPFRGTSLFELIQKQQHEQIPDPREVRPEIPADVVEIVRRLMAKDPADRYPDAAALAADLEAAATGVPLHTPALEPARSAVAKPRTVRRVVPAAPKRRPLLIAAGAGAGVVLALLAALLSGGGSPPPAPPAPKPPAPRPAPVAVVPQPPSPPPAPDPEPPVVAAPVVAPPPLPAPVAPPPPVPVPLPAPVPIPPPEPKPDPLPPPPDPKPAEPPAKPARPAAPAQEAARKRLRERFAADFARSAPSDRRALARKLLAERFEDPAEAYVGLQQARLQAIEAADVESLTAANRRLAEEWSDDAFELGSEGLAGAADKARTREAAREVVDAGLPFVEEAWAADRYEEAAALGPKLAAAAKSAGDAELKARADAVASRSLALARDWRAVSASAKTLSARPDDAAAALAVGRFLCLSKGDWERGLPLLARGSDASLRALAAKDLSNAEDATTRRDVVLGWLDLAERERSAPARRELLTERARDWFDRAAPELLDADRAKLEKRLAALEKLSAPRPKPVDLLAMADLRDARGMWRLEQGALTSPPSGGNADPAAIVIGWEPPEEYDLELVVERLQGSEDLTLGLRSGANGFGMGIDGWSGRASGINGPGGGFAWQQTAPGTRFANGRPSTVKVEVRRARAALLVDGRPVLSIDDYRRTSFPNYLVLDRLPNTITIATVRSSFRFTKIRVTPLSGPGRRVRNP